MKLNSPPLGGITTSTHSLVHMGVGKVAYIKPILSDDVQRFFPHAPDLESGLTLYALHSANGVPMLVTDSKESAVANAMQNQLLPLSLH